MVDSRMTFSDTLMQLGSEDFLRQVGSLTVVTCHDLQQPL